MIGRLRRFFQKCATDFEVGDFVRAYGLRGVGLIENISGDHATVAWARDRRDILPIACLRRTKAGGHNLDKRGTE